MTPEVDFDHAVTLQAWRARGDDRHDPVGFRIIEALARRAAGHRGAARRVLDGRLAELMTAYREARANAGAQERSAPPPECSELAELVGHMAAIESSHGNANTTARTLDYLRSTWLRLSTDRRMTQAQATVPDNPGPLNSHHLVHQALKSMRTLSPGYLDHFMSYVDALLWLDGANSVAGVSALGGQREAVAKRAARKKTG